MQGDGVAQSSSSGDPLWMVPGPVKWAAATVGGKLSGLLPWNRKGQEESSAQPPSQETSQTEAAVRTTILSLLHADAAIRPSASLNCSTYFAACVFCTSWFVVSFCGHWFSFSPQSMSSTAEGRRFCVCLQQAQEESNPEAGGGSDEQLASEQLAKLSQQEAEIAELRRRLEAARGEASSSTVATGDKASSRGRPESSAPSCR